MYHRAGFQLNWIFFSPVTTLYTKFICEQTSILDRLHEKVLPFIAALPGSCITGRATGHFSQPGTRYKKKVIAFR